MVFSMSHFGKTQCCNLPRREGVFFWFDCGTPRQGYYHLHCFLRRMVPRKQSKVDLDLNREIARLERQKLRMETDDEEDAKAVQLEDEIQKKRRQLMNVRKGS